MAKVEQRFRKAVRAGVDSDPEAAEGIAQYGGFDAERDVGPRADTPRATQEPEGRRSGTVSMPSVPRIRPKPRPGNLREVAEKIEEATGLRVQVLGGKLVMSPTPRGKHAKVVHLLEDMVRPKLPAELVAVEMASVEMPDELDDFVTPDLVVCPGAFLDSDDWLLDPRDVEVAVEVISQSEKAREIRDQADWYAVAGVAVLLVVDPRKGTWALHTRPGNGAYQDVLSGKFGESVRLPEPLGIDVDTAGFPVYGISPRDSRAQKGPFTESSQ
ncbi:Uma2 family endonuclease [Streptomyces sp. NPDC005648]|uniref:Uma2 family endonuclease n=1 Tax=Streptomyces sp. NPDC005648 TaxID=3157044 RepID=UPI0033ACA1D4